MKKFIRNWLGITNDMMLIDSNFQQAGKEIESVEKNIFELFHALPFCSGILNMNAKDAAHLTMPNGIEQNSPFAILTGILVAARQGSSYLQVSGKLSEDVRHFFISRGFEIQDANEEGDEFTYILWT